MSTSATRRGDQRRLGNGAGRPGGIEQEVVGDEPIGLGFGGDVAVDVREHRGRRGRRRFLGPQLLLGFVFVLFAR